MNFDSLGGWEFFIRHSSQRCVWIELGLGGVLDLMGLEHNTTEMDIMEILLSYIISILPMVIQIIWRHWFYQWLQTHDCEFEGRKRKIFFKLSMLLLCFFLTYFNQILFNFMTLLASDNIGDENFPMIRVINSFEVT